MEPIAAIRWSKFSPIAALLSLPNDKRPLVYFARTGRALADAADAFIYPGLGRLAERDDVAEMLVVLSQVPHSPDTTPWFDTVYIDPIRAELLVDHCFAPPSRPAGTAAGGAL